MNKKIGFIGFGEAVQSIVDGLSKVEEAELYVWYHRMQEDTEKAQNIRKKASLANVTLCYTLEELAIRSEVIINLTTSQAAIATAEKILPYLTSEQLYVDLNSTGPELIQELAQKMKQHSIPFVDGVIMAPVPLRKHRVPILASGDGTDKLIKTMEPLDMRIEGIAGDAGAASSVKMVRSLFMKSLAAVTIETYLMANLQGEEVFKRVFDSLNKTFMTPFEQLAERFLTGTIKHAGRRVGELEQAIDNISDTDVTPVMSESTLKLLKEMAEDKPAFEVVGGTDSQMVHYYQKIFERLNHRTSVIGGANE